MLTKYFAVIILLFCTSLCEAALVAHWALDENDASYLLSTGTATDSSDNGYTGTVVHSIRGNNWVSGRVNNAYYFLGNYLSAYIRVPSLLGSPAPVSFALWVNHLLVDDNGSDIISIGDYAGIRLGSTTVTGFYRYATGSRTTTYNDGMLYEGWNHVAYTVGTNSQNLYINGDIVATTAFTDALSYSGYGTQTYLGRHGNGSNTFEFAGLLDEVKVYNHVLSQSEVRTLCNYGYAETAAVNVSSKWGYAGELWDTSRIKDFSFAGYRQGSALPYLPVTGNVKNYGAVGDGVGTDTAAFLTAIESIGSGALYVPPGRYILDDRLLLENKTQFVIRGAGEDHTTLVFTKSLEALLGTHTSWEFGGGGLIWIGNNDVDASWPAFGTQTTTMTANSPSGSTTVTVASTAGLSVGQYVIVYLSNATGAVWDMLHGNVITAKSSDTLTAQYWVQPIKSINGNVIEFHEGLPYDIDTAWSPRIYTYNPVCSEIGIENLTIEFPDVKLADEDAATDLDGYNGFWIADSLNCWLRNVRIKHADNVGEVGRLSAFVTVDNVEVVSRTYDPGDYTYFGGYTGGGFGAYSGRYSFQCGASVNNVLYSNLDLTQAKYSVNLTNKNSSKMNVYRNVTGIDLNFDQHSYSPSRNLYSNINVGDGKRVWDSSGRIDVVKAGSHDTYWNIHNSDGSFVKSLPWHSPKCNVIPCQESTFPSDPLDRFGEVMSSIYPVDLYAAQYYKRTGKMSPFAKRNGAVTVLNTTPVATSGGKKVTALSLASLDEGLVGYWPFNEGVGSSTADLSGFGATGTLTGCTWGTSTNAGSLYFDGVDDYVTMPYSTGTNIEGSKSVSLSVWVYPVTQDGGLNYILFKHRFVSGTDRGGFYLHNSDAKPKFVLSNNSSAITISSPSVIGTTTWTHICAVYNAESAGSALLYINGIRVANGTLSVGIGTHTTTNMQLSAAVAANNINANIDNVRIYNRALSDAEAQTLYYLKQ